MGITRMTAETDRMLQEDYTVRLESFQGPLDLLLYLIRRAEVDILDIPIASLTNQYLGFLEQIDRIDIELAGEFLVMAATLMEIKSRMLMPPEKCDPARDRGEGGVIAETDLDQSDPRYELVKQLLAYKAFRDAAENLGERRHDWEAREPLSSAGIPRVEMMQDEEEVETAPDTDLEDIGVWDLFQTFQRIIEAVDFGRLGDHQVEYDDTPVQLHQEDLLDQLRTNSDRRLSLKTACLGRSRSEMIGLFLATLELVRQRLVTVTQDRVNDDIMLWLREEMADTEVERSSDLGHA